MSDVVATALAAQAHDLRNQLNTLGLAASVVEDEQLAADLRAAAGSLTRSIERLVVAARAELGTPVTSVRIPVFQVVNFAERRARREGATIDAVTVNGDAADIAVLVPGTWAERLVADLIHDIAAEHGPAIELSVDADEQHVSLHAGASGFAADAITQRIAAAVGATITDRGDGSVVVGLPR